MTENGVTDGRALVKYYTTLHYYYCDKRELSQKYLWTRILTLFCGHRCTLKIANTAFKLLGF
jgi:hypothetical protein